MKNYDGVDPSMPPPHEEFRSIEHLQHKVEQMKLARTEPIAVIGIGCRFAGDSNSPETFWQMLAEGRDAVEEVPPDRFEIDQFYDPDIGMPGKTVSRWGSFVKDVDQFDAAFFGISPREAMYMDPHQRILLEVAWEALERAGLPPEKLAGSSTGVFVGYFNKDYADGFTEAMVADRGASANAYMATGAGNSFAAGRISYLLGLQGPSMVVDTVCSSSLVAVHLACQSLRNDECQIALAGAVDLFLGPVDALISSKMRVLSPTGKCRTFDASADGFVRGDGCGVLVLKRESQALADGDTILALIRGSAVNHDGRSKGMLAPSRKAQEDVMNQALRNAGVAAEQITYVEAHGTGTKLGDPIEFEALKTVIGQARPEGSVCMVGSVKTNIGHLLAAAGMAALVKTIMCMQHQAIPRHLHLKTLSPLINLEHTPFVIPKQLSHWSVSGLEKRIAGVSAAGLSGTNAHIVLEEAFDSKLHDQVPNSLGDIWLLPISAKNPDGLEQLARTWCSELQSPGPLSNAPLRNICFTASLRRTHYQRRLALVGASHGELITQLEAFRHKKLLSPGINGGSTDLHENTRRPVFIFSGQGAQWAGMGQELFHREKVFRTALENCDALFRSYVSWSLLEELQAEEAQSRLHETAIAQAAIFSLQVALSELWRSWGIEPAAVVGHSVGEIAAAYVAGALDLEDAIHIVAQRGKLMQEAHGLGYMAAVEISELQAREYIVDYSGRVAIAAVNSPTSVVLSGETSALDEIFEKMLQSSIVARKLNVESAFHSPQMEPFRFDLVEILKGIRARSGTILLISTVTGERGSGEDCDSSYWGRNMCQPVLFGPAMENLMNMEYRTFIEISPHPVLARSVMQNLAFHEQSGLVLSSLRRGMSEQSTMLTALGSLYANGFEVNWKQIFRGSGKSRDHKVVPLPTYPWQRQRFWFPDTKSLSRSPKAIIAPSPSRLTGHPLLSRRVRSATKDNIFETIVSTANFPWLADHEASGMVIFPASAYIEMMHESVRMALNIDNLRLRDFYIHQALTLSPGQDRVVQLVLQWTSNKPAGEIQILSCAENDDIADEWTLHASGYYRPDRKSAAIANVADFTDLEVVRQRCAQHTEGREQFYQRMQISGLAYGQTFQALQQIWSSDGEALGQLCLPQQLASEEGSYFMHPAYLDACIHTAAAAVVSDGQDFLYLPLSMDGVSFYQRPGRELWVHITVSRNDSKQGLIVVQVHVLSERGEPVALIEGLHLRRASQSALAGQRRNSPPHWLYKIQWERKAHRDTMHGTHIASASPRSWLLFCDENGFGTQLAKDLGDKGEQCFLIFADQSYQSLNECEHRTLDPSNPEHFQRCLEEFMPMLEFPRCSIIYMWAMDAVASTQKISSSQQSLHEPQRICGGLLHLVQAVVQRRWATSPQLWVITQNSHDVSGMCAARTADYSSVAQAPLWGLGRVIAVEHPDLHCRLVDLPIHNSWNPEKFIEELLDPEPEDQIAFRMEDRYIARLVVSESDILFQEKLKQTTPTLQNHETFQFSSTGTYLITGGLGGLGITIGQWMVEQRGVRHLVLTGRSPPKSEVLSILRRLERHGAQILVVQADVSDQNQVAKVLETIHHLGVPLRGIVHAAGVLDDGVLVQLNCARFAKVFEPKVQGSWNLHLLTRDIPLEFFALFSSVASLVPAPGQANYGAANAFMDSLAHYRRSLGLPAVSINWGAWSNVGMTKDAKKFERLLEREGVELISLEKGMAAFEQVLLDDPIQIAVLPIDWANAKEKRKPPFFHKVAGKPPQSKRAAASGAALEDLEALKERSHLRPQITVEAVSRHAKKALGLDSMETLECGRNLFDMGVDSFMAVDLRNALQRETTLSLPANLVFDHPTVDAIAAYLTTQLPPAVE